MLTGGMRSYWVYILASRPRGTLYVGMARDLISGFISIVKGWLTGSLRSTGSRGWSISSSTPRLSRQFNVRKNIKHWSRKWKIDLIRSMNPDWHDLWEDIVR